VLSGHKKNGLSGIFLFDWVSNDEGLDVPFTHGLADCHSAYYVLVLNGLVIEIVIEFLCGVGKRVSNEDFVVLEEGRHFESQPVVHSSRVLSIDLTLFVRDFFTFSAPASVKAKDSFVFGH
jgi:hypothetical protein